MCALLSGFKLALHTPIALQTTVLVEAGHAAGARDRDTRMTRRRDSSQGEVSEVVAMLNSGRDSERSVDACQEGYSNLTRLVV
jgi:hypothetical protein